MARKATDRAGYSKSAGQSVLEAAVRECWPMGRISQDVSMRGYAESTLGYPWSMIQDEFGKKIGTLYADVMLDDAGDPVVFEYHGRQHFEFVQHFHGDAEGWRNAKDRDFQKEWVCRRLGIPFVSFRYDEDPTASEVAVRVAAARASMEDPPGYVRCPECDRIVLPAKVSGGECQACSYNRMIAEANRIDGRGFSPAGETPEERAVRLQGDRERRASQRRDQAASPAGVAAKERNDEYRKRRSDEAKEARRAYAASDEGKAAKEAERLRRKAYSAASKWGSRGPR